MGHVLATCTIIHMVNGYPFVISHATTPRFLHPHATTRHESCRMTHGAFARNHVPCLDPHAITPLVPRGRVGSWFGDA